MIELEPNPRPYLQSVPSDMQLQTDSGWWDGFKANVAYNNMPMIESGHEAYLFGSIVKDPSFSVADNIKDEYLPYWDDLVRAKNMDHLRFLENRVDKVIERREIMAGAHWSTAIAGGIADPLFLTAFVPALNAVNLGKTVFQGATRLGAVGAGYGIASEARRAPFAVADEDYEAAWNIGTATALSAVTGGILKGVPNAAPFIKSSTKKAWLKAQGKPFNHMVDEGKEGLNVGTDNKFDSKIENPFGSPLQRLVLDNKKVPQFIKEYAIKMNGNSSISLVGTADQAIPHSVGQRSAVYDGRARKMEETLRDLHKQHATNGQQQKARQFMGAYTADFNPFNQDFDEFLEDLITKYIQSTSPSAQRKALEGLSDQQKQGFTAIKEFFDEFDGDMRDVGLLKDDAAIKLEIEALTAKIEKKTGVSANIEASARKGGGTTAKQGGKLTDIDEEVGALRKRIVDLEDALQSPTRKGYVFSIYYDKLKLQDPAEAARFKEIFTTHYTNKGLPDPKQSADNTYNTIMEMDADDLIDARPAGIAGNSKHLKHRKTDIDEHLINDFMVKNIDVFYTYANRAGKKIEFQRAYDGKTIDELLDEIDKGLRKAKFADEDIAQIRSAFYGDHDRLMGALIRSPDRLDNQLSKFSKFMSGITYLGGAGLSAVTDIATITFAHGLRPTLKAGVAFLNANTRNATFKQAREAGTALDMARNIAQRKILGDSLRSVQPNKLERTQEIGSRFFYTANFLGPITTTYKVLDQILVNDKFIRLSKKLIDGTIDARDKEYLFRYGIDEELAAYINKMPTERAEADDFMLANTDAWPRKTPKDREMIRRYQAATNAHADNAVVMGTAFDRPLIMDGVTYIKDNAYTQAMRKQFPKLYEIDEKASTAQTKMVRLESGTMTLPFTFMNFAFGANNKILGAMRDPARKHRMQGAISLMAMSYITLEIKDRYWWRKAKDNWTDSPDMIARLVDHSGLTGIYADLGYLGLSMAANFSDSPEDFVISPRYLNPDRKQRFADGLTEPFGAPVGLGLSYFRATRSFLDVDFNEGSKELFYSSPFLGLPLIRDDMRDLMLGSRR